MAVQPRQLLDSEDAILYCTTTGIIISSQIFDIEDVEVFLSSLPKDIRFYDDQEITDLYWDFRVQNSNNKDIK